MIDQVLLRAEPVDLAFIDSTKSDTHVRWCVQKLLPRMDPKGVLLIDDVHWSRQMSGTWRRLRRQRSWALTADLWRLGLLAR